MHPRRDFRFSNENVQLLGGNLYGRVFTRRELNSCRECYQDFASRQVSRRDPGEEFFSWRDPGEHRFLGGILAEIRGGNFFREGSRWENGPPRWDPSEPRESWWDPGEIPVPILQGKQAEQSTTHKKKSMSITYLKSCGLLQLVCNLQQSNTVKPELENAVM